MWIEIGLRLGLRLRRNPFTRKVRARVVAEVKLTYVIIDSTP